MRTLLLTGCLLLSPLPAFACINDSGTDQEEEEFRRGYEEQEEPAEEEESSPWSGLAAALGTLGLGGAALKVLKGGAMVAV